MKRTNEEFSAEVFRRSNNYINKKRAQRRKALTLCVPLCVFTVVVSAVAIPYAMSGVHDFPGVEQTDTVDPSDETTNEPNFHVSLGSPNSSDVIFSSGEQARLLAEKLDALCADTPTTDSTASEEQSGTLEANTDDGRLIEPEVYYTVTVNKGYGEPTVYGIGKNSLYTSDGSRVPITAEEMASILEMMDGAFEERN